MGFAEFDDAGFMMIRECAYVQKCSPQFKLEIQIQRYMRKYESSFMMIDMEFDRNVSFSGNSIIPLRQSSKQSRHHGCHQEEDASDED